MRVLALFIDIVLVFCATFPLLILIYGWEYMSLADAGVVAGWFDVLISWVAPSVAVIVFWLRKQATPGKMLLALRVVDAASGKPISLKQAVIRYLGYILSAIPFGLGFLWVAIDPKKQGLHDKLAKTLVVQHFPPPARTSEPAGNPNVDHEAGAMDEARPDDTFLRA